MPGKRARSRDQTSFGTAGTPEALRSPPMGFPGTPPSAIVQPVPEFIWEMSVKIHFNPYVVVKQYVRTNAPQVFALGQWIKPPTAAPSDATKQGVHHELRR